jgi:hypothetical protein
VIAGDTLNHPECTLFEPNAEVTLIDAGIDRTWRRPRFPREFAVTTNECPQPAFTDRLTQG